MESLPAGAISVPSTRGLCVKLRIPHTFFFFPLLYLPPPIPRLLIWFSLGKKALLVNRKRYGESTVGTREFCCPQHHDDNDIIKIVT